MDGLDIYIVRYIIYLFIHLSNTHTYIYLCMYVCLSTHYIIYTSLYIYIYVCVRKWFLDKFARFRREMVWIHTQLGTDTAEICCNSDIIYIYIK